ncbi:MAG TPA: SRPBCC family protein [Ramlibacter sp.]|nr:SRPBCC family protein [Ramlibacter sp.]
MQMQGKIVTAAALAAGGALLLARQMRSARGPEAASPLEPSVTEVGTRPGRIGAVAALALGGLLLSNQLRKARASGASYSVDESLEVNVPVSTAYNQWTQFAEFPRFMDSVQEVKQLDDTHLHWRASVAGKTKEWDAEITEQIPDQRIAWRSTSGVKNEGVVTFNRIADNKTKIVLHIDCQPETAGEKIGVAVGGVKLTARGNLRRFRDLIEGRGVETGAWRGTITH